MKKIFFVLIILLIILSCGNSLKKQKEKKSLGLSEQEMSDYVYKLTNFMSTKENQLNLRNLINENGTPKITCSQKEILLDALLMSQPVKNVGSPLEAVALLTEQLQMINNAACYNTNGSITTPKNDSSKQK